MIHFAGWEAGEWEWVGGIRVLAHVRSYPGRLALALPIGMGCWCGSPGHGQAPFEEAVEGLGMFGVNPKEAIGDCLH